MPLGAQETTVVQTFIIACCNLAFSGGFALQLGALSNSTWAVMNIPKPLPGDSQDVRNNDIEEIMHVMYDIMIMLGNAGDSRTHPREDHTTSPLCLNHWQVLLVLSILWVYINLTWALYLT